MHSHRRTQPSNSPLFGECDSASRYGSIDPFGIGRAAVSAGRLVNQHFPELQPADVDDSVGDACLQLVERICSSNAPGSPARYLSSAAVRSADRRSDSEPVGDTARSPLSVPDFAEQLIDAMDLKRELREPRALSGSEATAWQLKALCALSVDDIAAQVGCCRETVYRRVRDATEKLTHSLNESRDSALGDEGRQPA